MKPEYKDVEYMGGSVRAVTGPDGAVQHITEPGGYFDFLKDAWEDYRKALEDFFATPVNDEKIIAAGKRWERFGRILIGYAGTMFDLYRDDAEKRRLILDLYDRFSKDMAVVQRNISKYRALLNAAEAPDPEALKRADDAKIESSRSMLRALNTQLRFSRLYQNGDTYAGAEAELEEGCSERSEQLFEKLPKAGIYKPAWIYPPLPFPEGTRVPEPPEAYKRVESLPVDDLVYDEALDEFVVRPGYVSEDGLIDERSVVWHPEDHTVVIRCRGGEPVIWRYWKPKDLTDVPERDSWPARYIRRYYRQRLEDLEMKVFDPEKTAVLDEKFWKTLCTECRVLSSELRVES